MANENAGSRSATRGTCPRCGRSFILTKGGELRKHKCSAAAPLAVDGSQGYAMTAASPGNQYAHVPGAIVSMPSSMPSGPTSAMGMLRSDEPYAAVAEDLPHHQRRVWSNVGMSLLRISRDGLEAGFSVLVSTMASLNGLRLMNASHHEQFPPRSCGRVLAGCSELVDVRKGSVIIGIGDRLLRQPPLEQIPFTSDATNWFRDRLRAYQAVGWDHVPVYCHGPVPAAVRQSLQAIENKLLAAERPPEQCLTREELLLVQRTLATVSDSSLEAFEANGRSEEHRAAQIRRSRALREWQALPDPFPTMEDDDDFVDDDDDEDHVPLRMFAAAIDVIASDGWLTTQYALNGRAGRHFLDELCSLRVVSKAMARALFVFVRRVRASDFRQDRLDPVVVVRNAAGPGAPDRRITMQAAYAYAKRYATRHGNDALAASLHLPTNYQNTSSGDRFCNFVSSRFANVSHLEIPVLPGTTELGIRVSLSPQPCTSNQVILCSGNCARSRPQASRAASRKLAVGGHTILSCP